LKLSRVLRLQDFSKTYRRGGGGDFSKALDLGVASSFQLSSVLRAALASRALEHLKGACRCLGAL
jgi:hypothetical protein